MLGSMLRTVLGVDNYGSGGSGGHEDVSRFIVIKGGGTPIRQR
jgi:hypothetical protein